MVKMQKKQDPHADREAQKYGNPIPSREFILSHLADRGRPATRIQLSEELDIKGVEQEEGLRRRLIAMVRDGQLLKNRQGAYGPLKSMELIAGRVVGRKDGFGFVVPDTGGDDLFLSPRQMRMVFHGDRVLARVAEIDTHGRREAVIVEVLEHSTQQLVGRYFEESGVGYVEPSNHRVNQDVLVPSTARHEAKHGQVVVVAITTYPTRYHRAIGEVVEVLGDHMAPGMEINIAIRNHELPNSWPAKVLTEISRFPMHVTADVLHGRVDFRHLPFVTIDGDDAKDFDDAVYCEPRDKGGWNLYVAITDVSYYVLPDSPLDKEAYLRGNSVYFPARVIPMLPEVLSNNLCSLKPYDDRLVLVCEMVINASGRITRYAFHEGVICSQARLTYNQVHALMEKSDKRAQEKFKKIMPHLAHLYALFHVLFKAREARGAIDFSMPETKIVFGSNRKIEKIVPYERFDSHRVIEECMLCANISAALFLLKQKQPALYRVHEGPSEEKLTDLRRFLNELGLKLPGQRQPTPAGYAKLLRSLKGRPDADRIQMALLRSLSQAVYTPDNRGHFGLAYEAYTHFTSPIRRYPDLLVHRAIKQVLMRHKQARPEQDPGLQRVGEHCSMTERRADDATREATDWLKCEFMLDKVGQEFLGRVSGVTSFGIFVALTDVYVEGLVHISVLPDDYYQFDLIKHALMGQRTGRAFRIGDPVKIKVARVDLDQCEIDFVLAEGQRSRARRHQDSRTNTKHKIKESQGKKQATHRSRRKK
jgi:ribonuclease R